MSTIVPSFPPSSKGELIFKLEALRGLVRRVQIDVVDGLYAYPASFPYCVDGTHHALTSDSHLQQLFAEFEIEIDAMVKEGGAEMPAYMDAGAVRAVLHIESIADIGATIADFKKRFDHDKNFQTGLISLGLALSLSTPPSALDAYIDDIDFVQCMGIARIGVQRQPFDERVYDHIAYFKKNYPTLPVQVDGGISLENAPKLLSVGVSTLCVGSHLWHGAEVASELEKFTALIEQYGTYES